MYAVEVAQLPVQLPICSPAIGSPLALNANTLSALSVSLGISNSLPLLVSVLGTRKERLNKFSTFCETCEAKSKASSTDEAGNEPPNGMSVS